MLQYLQERKELGRRYEQENYNTMHIIKDYQTGYDRLVNRILENPNDIALIKSAIQEIVTNYAWILELNHRSLFYTFSGVTDGYWKDLEPKGKKYMIIIIASGDYVRSAGVSGGDLSYADIFEKFVIVDGIDYKSNTETHKLCYMEV